MTRKLIFTLFCVAVIVGLAIPMSGVALAVEPPEVEWEKTYGGEGSHKAFSLQVTADGGYITAGATDPSGGGNVDVYLVKTDANGNMVWSNTLGGSGWDDGNSIDQTADGGYIITGETLSYGGGNQVYLVKADADGDEVWSRTFGVGEGYSVQQTTDGGYILTGVISTLSASGDIYLVKTDANGSEEWSRTFGGSGNERGHAVQQTTDGGYIVAGTGGDGVYLVKTDSNGSEQWSATFGGEAHSVQQTADGGYIVGGSGLGDLYLMKTDSNGNEEWSSTFGGHDAEYARSVKQTSDGGYIAVGVTHSFGAGSADVYLVRTDSSGNELWSMTFGGVDWDVGYAVGLAADGGYVVAGYTVSYGGGGSDVYLVKLAAEGGNGNGGNGGGFCFIATAAYGSYLDSHVETLRDFRDSYLLTNPVGSAIVSAYYQLSPPVAEFIDDHPALKPVVRVGLLPAVAMSTVAVSTTLAEKLAIVGSLAFVSVALAVWLSRRRGKGSEYS